MKAGWQVKRLGEVCTLQRGFDLPSVLRTKGDYPLVTSSGPTDTHCDYKVQGPGVVTGRSGSIGNVFFVDDHFWPLNTALYVKDFHGNDQRFVWYLLQYFDLSRFATGAGVPTLNRNDVHGEAVLIPTSLVEQKRIVAILDEAFEGLTRARAHTETNLQNARELFESVSKLLFSDDHDWRVEDLNTNVQFVDYRGKTPPKTSSGIRLITAKNVKRGYIQREPEEFMDEDAYEEWMTRGFPVFGDVLFTTEAPLANVAQLDTEERVVIGQRLITMKANPAVLDAEFLKFALLSPPMQEEIVRRGTGATVQGIKASLLKTIQLKFPKSLDEQHEIAQKCRMAFQIKDEVQNLFRAKLADLDALRQSLLQKAFAGELT